VTGKQPQDLLADTNNWQWRTPDLQVSDAFAAILDRMLRNAPTERFQSARDVLEALEDAWGVPSVSIPTANIPPASTSASSTLLSVAIENNLPQVEPNSLRIEHSHPPIEQPNYSIQPIESPRL
jgi:serine/threonine protein kinase, bacterial